MSVLSAATRVVRAAAALWLVAYAGVLRPVFPAGQLRLLLEARPELAVGGLVLESLPAVVGAAWILRALRPGSFPGDGPFAAAGRWASLLAMAGLVLPLHAADPSAAARELGLRAVTFICLASMLDGPLEPGR
jgi:hypothetical protein